MSLREQCNSESAQEVKRVLSRVGDKWSLLVISLLGHRAMRFNEIRREIDEISQRMLTLTLRNLERDGLVTRTVYPTVPPKVEYELTLLGHTLLETIQSLVNWTVSHLDDIARAREAYDLAHESIEPLLSTAS
ncbi:helix-turn-helix domain-containing protein [soil metagenome]